MVVMEVALGLVIAIAIGLTGVGAGTLTAPALILWFGVPPVIAVGTALAFGAVVKVPAVIAYFLRGQVDLKIFSRLALGGIPGVVVGGVILQTLDRAQFEGIALLLVGAVVVLSALLSVVAGHRRPERAGTQPTTVRSRLLTLLAFPIGIEVGFSSAGAGALGAVLLFQCTELSAATVVGTDLLFGITLSGVGGGLQAALGTWDIALLSRLLAGGVVGAFLGARLATRIPPRYLRPGLLLWLCYVGTHLTFRGLSLLLLGPD